MDTDLEDSSHIRGTDTRQTSSNARQFDFFAREEDRFQDLIKNEASCSMQPSFGGPLRADRQMSQMYLSVVWQSGVLGAAIYNAESCTVDLLIDVQERAPSFELLRSLIAIVEPFLIVTDQGTDDRLKEFLSKTAGERGKPVKREQASGTTSTQRDNDDPTVDHPSSPQLHLLPSKDFGYGPAKQRIGRVRLPAMPDSVHDSDAANLFLATVIDFKRYSMIRAFGGLLTFLDRVSPVQTGQKSGVVPVVTIRMFTMDDDVAIDQNSLNALRVFHSNTHPSVFKAGKGVKEGFSLFSLFNHCKSSVGKKLLRLWFSRPTRSHAVLRARHQAIHFFMNPQNGQTKTDLEKILTSLKDVTTTMGRMAKGACTLSDWAALNKTSLCGFMISKLIERENLPLDVEIFGKIKDTFPKDLARIAKLIHDVVDFEASETEERFVVKPNVVDELDDMKRRLHSLNERLTYIATEELARMDGETKEIRVTYIPNMGYLLVLDKDHRSKENEPADGSSDYSIPGLEFVFKAKSGLFYKSDRMRELDNDDANFGDLTPKIHDCERAIMIQLQSVILRYTESLFAVMFGAAELDCLIAIASTAVYRNYVVPEIGEDFGIHVEDGRHPLQELCVTTFVPNSTDLGKEFGRVSVITGPNMSGKSVYLKQVAIIVFLAHVGCPVPATSARIGLVDKMFTRLLSEETVAVRQSAFLIDLTQVGIAVNYSTERSLIILDEFGKGTRSSDGLALLASILNYFITGTYRMTDTGDESGVKPTRSEDQSTAGKCPCILLATHFHSLKELIPASDVVQYLTLDHMQSDTDNLVFLYKVKSGVSASSYAVETSRAVGFMDSTLQRIMKITNSLKYNQPIEPLAKLRVAGFSTVAKSLLDKLASYDPSTHDARVVLDETLAIVHRGPQQSQRDRPTSTPPPDSPENSDVPETTPILSQEV